MASSHEDRESDAPRRSEDENVSEAHGQSIWRSIWENNKGALMILLSEAFGSSMDATARYLQQGGTGFHTLQASSISWTLDHCVLNDTPDRRRSHGNHLHPEHFLHVVDQGALFPLRRTRGQRLARPEGHVWLRRPLHSIL